jgi:hypothetical protein
MSEWRLITTAPKDGTEIFVFWYESGWPIMALASWDPIQSGWYDGEWDVCPTHWMPLPEPPTDAKTELGL